MTKQKKRCLTIGLSSLLVLSTTIPTSIALVACSGEQDQTNSSASNANRPSNKPNHPSTKPNQPSNQKPSKPVTVAYTKFSSSQIQSIYKNVQTKIKSLLKSKDFLPLITYSYLNNRDVAGKPIQTHAQVSSTKNPTNNASKPTTATKNGFMTDVMNDIYKLTHTNATNIPIKTASFEVNRYLQCVTLNLEFYPNTIPSNLLPKSNSNHQNNGTSSNPLSNMQYGANKNIVIMAFTTPGIANYVTNHDLEIAGNSLQEYVQNLYDESITYVDYNILNSRKNELIPILIKNGFNAPLYDVAGGGFSIPTAGENAATFHSGFGDSPVTYDPDCTSGYNWEFDRQWGQLCLTWHGDLSRLYTQGRLNVLNVYIQRAITAMASEVNYDPKKLDARINNRQFIQDMWNKTFEMTGLKLIQNGKVLTYLPIKFYDITTGKARFDRDSFLYRYTFTLPLDTPISATMLENGWVDKYFNFDYTDTGIVVSGKAPMYAFFVPLD